jgi:hypothetical protein
MSIRQASSVTSRSGRTPTSGPSRTLMTSALSGLLGLGAVSCGDTAKEEPDPTADAACVTPDGGASPVDASDAAPPSGPVVISETEGNRTFANVKTECDTRGGYTQVAASCAGVNSCAGFSYGDWDPGVTSEHTCAGMNGCNGISCVVLPTDAGKTGKEVYEAKLPETGSRSCANCHADWSSGAADMTKFKVWVQPGSTRTLANWLDRKAAEQARIVAFGSHGVLPDGSAYTFMAPYHKLFSKVEIEKVVEYIRSGAVTPVLATIKTQD